MLPFCVFLRCMFVMLVSSFSIFFSVWKVLSIILFFLTFFISLSMRMGLVRNLSRW